MTAVSQRDGVKSKLWNLRLEPETMRLWQAKAAALGLSLTEYVRTLVTEDALSSGVESEEEMAAVEETTTDAEAEDLQTGEADMPEAPDEVDNPDYVNCLACGAKNDLAAQYCSSCGQQMPANMQAEGESLAETAPAEIDPEAERQPWEGVLGTIGSPTTDGRYLIPGKIENRELPVPFSVQPSLAEGHEGAINAGRIEEIDYIPFAEFDDAAEYYTADQIAAMPADAVVIFGKGTVDNSPAGQEAARQIDNGADVSLDGLRMDGTLWDSDTFAEVDTAELGMDEVFSGILEGKYLQGLSGKVGGATVVGIGAFEEAKVAITASGSLHLVDLEAPALRFAALVAAAGPLKPPREWFEDPMLKELTPLKITKDGRVFGHLCDWNGCHTGFQGVCVPPFRSPSNYAFFNVGEIETGDGALVPCGKLMFSMDGGKHAEADPSLSYLDVQRHYDDATKVGGFVRAGADRFGTWLAGTLRPGLSDLEIQHLRLHPPSGDWRPVRGSTELVAAFAVAVPGYPIPRQLSLVASARGDITAIITAPLEIEESESTIRRRKRLKEEMGTSDGHKRSRAEMRREIADRLAFGPWDDGLEELAPTADQRRAWAKSGVAMPDGSYPITTCTGPGTSAINARRAIGRAPASKRAAVKAHIATREKALGCSND